jgi:hypothetical protein
VAFECRTSRSNLLHGKVALVSGPRRLLAREVVARARRTPCSREYRGVAVLVAYGGQAVQSGHPIVGRDEFKVATLRAPA